MVETIFPEKLLDNFTNNNYKEIASKNIELNMKFWSRNV